MDFEIVIIYSICSDQCLFLVLVPGICLAKDTLCPDLIDFVRNEGFQDILG